MSISNFLNSVIIKFVLIAVVVFLQLSVWFSDSGYVHYRQIHNKAVEMQSVNENYKKDNLKLKKSIMDLKSDGKLLDKNAREKLGMVGPGETLYQVSES